MINDLLECDSIDEMILLCSSIVKKSKYVGICEHHTFEKSFNSIVHHSNSNVWRHVVNSTNDCFRYAIYCFAMNSSLNGGYFRKDGNNIVKWEINGSGSYALKQLIDHIKVKHLLPGYDLLDPLNVETNLTPLLKDVPFNKERMDVFKRFSNLYIIDQIIDIINRCYTDGKYIFTIKSVAELVKILPEGYSGDPMRKKAILFFLYLSGYLVSKGNIVENYLPIPSDYQIPRILEWLGIIEISDCIKPMFYTNELLDVESELVMDIRAASIISCDKISKMAKVDNYVVDSSLFTYFRNCDDFKDHSIPTIKCNSFWF